VIKSSSVVLYLLVLYIEENRKKKFICVLFILDGIKNRN
jgi:hypothetical protein